MTRGIPLRHHLGILAEPPAIDPVEHPHLLHQRPGDLVQIRAGADVGQLLGTGLLTRGLELRELLLQLLQQRGRHAGRHQHLTLLLGCGHEGLDRGEKRLVVGAHTG